MVFYQIRLSFVNNQVHGLYQISNLSLIKIQVLNFVPE